MGNTSVCGQTDKSIPTRLQQSKGPAPTLSKNGSRENSLSKRSETPDSLGHWYYVDALGGKQLIHASQMGALLEGGQLGRAGRNGLGGGAAPRAALGWARGRGLCGDLLGCMWR